MPYALVLVIFVLVWRGIQDYGTSPLAMARCIEVHPGLETSPYDPDGGDDRDREEHAGNAGEFAACQHTNDHRAPTPDAVPLDERELDSRLR